MNKRIIYFTGFMGSGKSTIGPILANTLGWDFFDLDKVIEKKAGKKVRVLFEENGEDYFRKIETETLKELSAAPGRLIVSLGGGTIANEENLKILKSTGTIIYLKITQKAAFERLKFKRDRPALIDKNSEDIYEDNLSDKINKMIKSRAKFYEQADFTISSDSSSVGKTVDTIVKIIKEAGLT
jgi:shikimate kinase